SCATSRPRPLRRPPSVSQCTWAECCRIATEPCGSSGQLQEQPEHPLAAGPRIVASTPMEGKTRSEDAEATNSKRLPLLAASDVGHREHPAGTLPEIKITTCSVGVFIDY